MVVCPSTMNICSIIGFLLCIFLVHSNGNVVQPWGTKRFNEYYKYLWGSDHFQVNRDGSLVTLKFDNTSGAGFRSISEFGYGQFSVRMKIPWGRSRGIIPNIYLTSAPDNQDPGNHFELDFEFMGTNGIVQTNVYAMDTGGRQQSFKLWFDPRENFHTYGFLWNPYHIVFIIDGIPVREFKNNAHLGVPYPNKPMHVEGSIWHADFAGAVDWSQAPFITSYSDFTIYSCYPNGVDISGCGSDKYFWNGPQYRYLNPSQKNQMYEYRRKYMSYDYCSKPETRKKECSLV